MGEAKRRAEQKAREELHAGFERLHIEGQGVWSLECFDCAVIPAILLASATGDRRACMLKEVVTSIVRGIDAGSKTNEPVLCLTCETAFKPHGAPPGGFCVLTGAVPDAKEAIVNVLCEGCFRHPEVIERVFATIRSMAIQDARLINIGEPGYA